MAKWRVDFYGSMMNEHLKRLEDAGVEYEHGGSEAGPGGEVRGGLARHEVLVEADDEQAAEKKVQDAFGADATSFSEWHVRTA